MMRGRTKARPCVNAALAQHSTSVLHIGTFRSRQNRHLIRLPSFISPPPDSHIASGSLHLDYSRIMHQLASRGVHLEDD